MSTGAGTRAAGKPDTAPSANRPAPTPARPNHVLDGALSATVLAILAVPTSTAMAIMGWSSAAMATRYQHVLDSTLKGVAGQVGGLLWDAPESDPAADDDDGEGTAGVLAPA